MTHDDIALRDARPDDAPCLSILAMQVFLDTYCKDGIRPALAREVRAQYGVEVFEHLLARPDGRLVVAERDGHLVGFSQCALRAALPVAGDAARPAELERLYVQEPFTGRHLGTRLLARAEADLAAAGADQLWLTPWVGNARALAFYARRGYADIGQAWYAFEGERHENRVFAKALAPAR